jgi:hypothetical protein
MTKSIFSTKTLVACMVMMGSLMATSEALAGCRWYDAGCKAREAADKVRRAAEEAARAAQAAADRARAEAEARAAEARRIAEQAAALAAQQAAAARAAAEAAARAALEVARQRAPMQPNEAANFANARLNQAGSGAVNAMMAASSGITRAANDVNAGFRSAGDALDNELKKLNVQIPDVAGYVQEAVKPAAGQVKSFDAFRRTMDSNFAKLDSNDIGAIWSVMRTVMEQKRPSNEQIAEFDAAMRDLFGDVANGCAVCPMPGPSGVGISVTVSSPTVSGATGLPIPLGASVTFRLVKSTYLVNGRPQYVADYAVNAEATTAVRTIPEVSLGVTWINGELATNVLPLPSLSVSVAAGGAPTVYGSFAAGGGVGLTMPESVYMFLDKGERNKLLATLKNPSQGPAYVIDKANQALRDMETMVRNPSYEAGISVGMPGSVARIKADGALVMSVAGVIASF